MRHLRLQVSGGDLVARGHAPGPAIGEALAATRAARLDGEIAAEEELSYALERLEHSAARVSTQDR